MESVEALCSVRNQHHCVEVHSKEGSETSVGCTCILRRGLRMHPTEGSKVWKKIGILRACKKSVEANISVNICPELSKNHEHLPIMVTDRVQTGGYTGLGGGDLG